MAAALIGAIAVALSGCGGGTPPGTVGLPTSAPRANYTAADALAFVTRIYAPYARADVTTPLLGNCFFIPPTGRPCAGPARDFVTPKLKARLEWRANQGTGVDPMDCAQNRPTAVTFGRPKVTGWAATIVVHESFSAGGDHPSSVTVDLRRLKLTEVGC